MNTKNYFIKFWETEEDRNQGNANTHKVCENKNEALKLAEKLFYDNDFACVEVHCDNESYVTFEN